MAISVMLGAFGAHSFENILLENGRLDTYETAMKYMTYHSLGILLLGAIYQDNKYHKLSLLFMLIGIVLFSGSLIILSFTNITKFAIITPFGGLFFIVSWIMLILSLVSVKKNN